jgi:hypothetical protein
MLPSVRPIFHLFHFTCPCRLAVLTFLSPGFLENLSGVGENNRLMWPGGALTTLGHWYIYGE